MTPRIEASRRHGPHDPRWPVRTRLAAPQHATEEPARIEKTHRVAVADPGTAEWEAEGGAVR